MCDLSSHSQATQHREMKIFVVGYLSMFENELVLEKVEAENEMDALCLHSQLSADDNQEWMRSQSSVEELLQSLADGDIIVEVIEVGPAA